MNSIPSNLPPAEKPLLVERYETSGHPIFLSGMQALVRLPIEQMRRDAANGLRTRVFVTGYPGSPLSGYDIALAQARDILKKHGIKHVPGQNEELAATALMGTQMLDDHPHPDVDGVVGYWYGKGPGADRSGDAFKHGNFAGTGTHGAVVILSGEDHDAKSSSVPHQQEFAFEHCGIPVLYPATVEEFLTFGLHAAEMSRFSGCWVALKLVGALCDGGSLVTPLPDYPKIVLPEVKIDGKPFRKKTNFKFFPVLCVETERELYMERHVAAVAYARANGLNRIVVKAEKDRLGLIAAGKSYTDMRQALLDLGFDEARLSAAGIRIAKVGMLCPAEDGFFRAFADGLERIVVVEEKRDFLERQVSRAIGGLGPIRIMGKSGEAGEPLFPVAGGMDADMIAELLGRLLKDFAALPEAGERRLRALSTAKNAAVPELPRRTPNYCSGCPHNVSTLLAAGQVAWGAPGCHVFASLMEQPERRIEALTQFGGEGVPWIGLSPYTSKKHIVQNVGDGSFFHSSYQNIRFAVAAGVNITFRILLNGVVANTGGQRPVGTSSVPDLLTKLAADGVKRIVLAAADPKAYRKLALPANAVLRRPDQIQASMAELRDTAGVTVLLYDGACANERRRRQKRGILPPPTTFTVINEDVCGNCGDCGRTSNCMSLQKVETEFGPKTQIHQSSCNHDLSCIRGECPSFVTVRVKPGAGVRKPPLPDIGGDLPPPLMPGLDRPYHIYIPGVGGTGVITANAILAEAAVLDGNDVKSFDQTGAAQKWGPVLSSLIVSAPGQGVFGSKVGVGRADLYLALDPMAASDGRNLVYCDPAVTTAVVNSDLLPSGEMIRNVRSVVEAEAMIAAIRERTSHTRGVVIAARTAAERLLGDYMMANMIAIGAAYQAGLLPISAGSIERAIRLNGAQAEANVMAFRIGRWSQHAPERFNDSLAGRYKTLPDRLETPGLRRSRSRERTIADIAGSIGLTDANARRAAEIRIADLIAYQNAAYARRFARFVAAFAATERAILPANGEGLTLQLIRNLHNIMAYKDEYEVARLLTGAAFARRIKEFFPAHLGVSFHLHPPLLRSFGMTRKIAVPGWFAGPLRALSRLKFVRGTRFDPFSRNPIRRMEKELVGWYLALAEHCRGRLMPANQGFVEQLLTIPDSIRGYEHVKAANVEATKQRAAALLAVLDRTGSVMAA